MVSLEPFLEARVRIYKRLYSTRHTVLVDLGKEPFKSAEWAASFEKDAAKEGCWARHPMTLWWKHVIAKRCRIVAVQRKEKPKTCGISCLGNTDQYHGFPCQVIESRWLLRSSRYPHSSKGPVMLKNKRRNIFRLSVQEDDSNQLDYENESKRLLRYVLYAAFRYILSTRLRAILPGL